MNKTISMSIRVSEEELDKLKHAARLESYASYSEFIRRTALEEADKILMQNVNSNEDKELPV
ncbi:plasmid mobilization protein [Clostridium fessum]|uniref:plasmid mobilization protein n=1 Tax=Clostridium fessum TaxID=2126740 RepID=UPI0039A215CF